MSNEIYEQLLEAVREMRKLQKEYFKASPYDNFKKEILKEAKEAEKKVDKLLSLSTGEVLF